MSATPPSRTEALAKGRISVPAIEVGESWFGFSHAATHQRLRRGTFPLPVREIATGRNTSHWVMTADLEAFERPAVLA